MSSTLALSEPSLAAAPVIVTSPTTRCGTTLVQRLLCASDNAFVYGEEIGNQFRTLAGMLVAQIRHCEANGEAMDEGFRLAMAGTLREWRPGLAPPAQTVVDAWAAAFYQLPMTLHAFGQSLGRPIWGFKWPGCPSEAVRTFLTLMPRAKVIYVLRNAADALASAKARRFVVSTDDAARYCADWTRSVKGFAAIAGDPRLMILKYEDLIADREQGLRALSAFTGAQNIRRSEFDLKVNTFEGDEAEGRSPTQYIAPLPLTEADWAVLEAEAGEAMAELYPALAPA
ncbi:MAG: sulfotransferase [Caulobacteraceae bacterium]